MSHEPYDIKPSEADLNDESLARQQPAGEDDYSKHSGYRGCRKCQAVGAHQWTRVCACCGKEQSRFHEAEYLESDVAYD
jgi:uncharacterized paraquat-inducible protein A